MEERKKILEAVAGEVGGQAKIIAHVGNIGSALTEDLARHAKACGVDAVSAITPFYYQFSSQEIVSYYEDLANAVELPTVVYHFPGQTGELPEPAPDFRRFRCHCCGPASISEKDRRILW